MHVLVKGGRSVLAYIKACVKKERKKLIKSTLSLYYALKLKEHI